MKQKLQIGILLILVFGLGTILLLRMQEQARQKEEAERLIKERTENEARRRSTVQIKKAQVKLEEVNDKNQLYLIFSADIQNVSKNEVMGGVCVRVASTDGSTKQDYTTGDIKLGAAETIKLSPFTYYTGRKELQPATQIRIYFAPKSCGSGEAEEATSNTIAITGDELKRTLGIVRPAGLADWIKGDEYRDKKEYANALPFLTNALEAGYAQAGVTIGWFWYEGLGVSVDKEKALWFWRSAADSGNPWAQHSLAYAYLKNRQYEESAPLARAAALSGSARAYDILDSLVGMDVAKAKDAISELIKHRGTSALEYLDRARKKSVEAEKARNSRPQQNMQSCTSRCTDTRNIIENGWRQADINACVKACAMGHLIGR